MRLHTSIVEAGERKSPGSQKKPGPLNSSRSGRRARDAVTTGSANVLAANANEINVCISDLRGTGATFSTGTYAVTAGTATTPARLTFPATAVAADVTAFLTNLNNPGIMSFGHTASISKIPTTPTSYTYTIVGGIPVFAGVPGATP